MREDALLTRIALTTTAVQLERRLARKDAYKSTELTYGCLNLLQGRLSDDIQAVSNETIIAISQLIALEVSQTSQFYVHPRRRR